MNINIEDGIERSIKHLADPRVQSSIKIQSTIRQSLRDSLVRRGFMEISPTLLSPLTDPLNHPVYDPCITVYGEKMWLTKSMIFHKQIAVQQLKKIFIMSPNIRLETEEKASSGRHLFEFTQIDIEELDASREVMMDLAEVMINEALAGVRSANGAELAFLSRACRPFPRPFNKIAFQDAVANYGEKFEERISKEATAPVWIVDIPLKAREFYDREYPDRPGILRDMDLLWPEGYQEALSGGEREFQYEKIMERIRKKEQAEEQFRWFTELAKRGIRMSSGFGIGIERFTRYVCGLEHVGLTNPFPKIPGTVSL